VMIRCTSKVPLPLPCDIRHQRGNYRKYPWWEMKIGDSFFVAPPQGRTMQCQQERMAAAAANFVKRHGLTWRFSTRQIEAGTLSGVRVFRVDDAIEE
jgi:hypothetical protein